MKMVPLVTGGVACAVVKALGPLLIRRDDKSSTLAERPRL